MIELIIKKDGVIAFSVLATPKKNAHGTLEVQIPSFSGKLRRIGTIDFDETEGAGEIAKKMLTLVEEVSPS